MKKQTNALWKILLFSVITNITACKKIENTKLELNKTIDGNVILIESYKFKMVQDNLIKDIIEIDQAIKQEGLQGFDFNNYLQNESLDLSLKNVYTKEDILLAYSKNGITNGVKIVSLIENKMYLFKLFINKYDSLKYLSKNDIKIIISYAIKNKLKYNIPNSNKASFLEENCLSVYKNGIADCEEEYQSALIDSFATTTFMLLTSGPLSSIVNFTYTAYKAVTNYNSCNNRVIRNFKSCITEINNAS